MTRICPIGDIAEAAKVERWNAASARRGDAGRPARTLLEQLIRSERGETFEEFVTYAEEFARANRLPGTLSLRHLLRLVSGRKTDGTPLGTPRPATANLLERIFGVAVTELLKPPRNDAEDDATVEIRQRLSAARHVDLDVIELLRGQLNALRRLDRQMGAIVAYGEVREKVEQVRHLHSYSVRPAVRTELARLLAELGALAGWEALDRYEIGPAWEHHELAKQAAREAGAHSLLAHTIAQQAFVLSELGEIEPAVAQLAQARALVRRTAPGLLRAWLAAAHGEGLAVAGRRNEALRAFDEADSLLPGDPVDPTLPFLFLEGAHLDRWRGHALTRLGDAEAVGVLTSALDRLDLTFTRAETALHVDLATALTGQGELVGARVHVERADQLANEIGSVRQWHRMCALISLAAGSGYNSYCL
jgi:tetratricopeptide (TPR) repeat protein